MSVSYKRLWKLLIDRDMTKGQLRELSGISTRSLAKLGKNEDVRVDVLVKICGVLECTMNDSTILIPLEAIKNKINVAISPRFSL